MLFPIGGVAGGEAVRAVKGRRQVMTVIDCRQKPEKVKKIIKLYV